MWLLIIVILAVWCYFTRDNWNIQPIPAIALTVCIIATLSCLASFVYGRTLDAKIAMYTEENTVIEQSIDELVDEYMEYEAGTFSELKGDSAITLVSLYPELKSDELVQAQIDTYLANNAKIKELKNAQINQGFTKWWLYFGK